MGERCFYCEDSYMAGDELLCIHCLEGKGDCNLFILADYFVERVDE